MIDIVIFVILNHFKSDCDKEIQSYSNRFLLISRAKGTQELAESAKFELSVSFDLHIRFKADNIFTNYIFMPLVFLA